MEAEIERVRKSFRAELVPYKGATTDLIRADDVAPAACGRSASSATRSSVCRAALAVLRCAYGIAEGKRTRGGATVRGRPRG